MSNTDWAAYNKLSDDYTAHLTLDQKIALYRQVIGVLRLGTIKPTYQMSTRQRWDYKAALREAHRITDVRYPDNELPQAYIKHLGKMLDDALSCKAAVS
jgi:maltooligosyltrehalose synthase